MNEGWVKIHRQIQGNAFCYGSSERLGFWVQLLLMANHETKEFYMGRQKITCKKGEIITGREKLSLETGLHRSKIERHLDILEKEKMIEQQTTTKFRKIIIKNWDKFQVNEQQMSNKRATDEQQMSTNKNVKNVKNEKNTYATRSETKSLYNSIEEICSNHPIENKVKLKSLDVLVARYLGKIKMKVELQHCISWLLDKDLKTITTQRLGNWFKKALEIQSRDTRMQLEKKDKRQSEDQSVEHFESSQHSE